MAWLEEEQGSGANRNKELKALIVAALKNKGGAKTGNGNTAPVAINDDSILNALDESATQIYGICEGVFKDGSEFKYVFFTGGGSELLRSRMLSYYKTAM
jgi:hypothetical protein